MRGNSKFRYQIFYCICKIIFPCNFLIYLCISFQFIFYFFFANVKLSLQNSSILVTLYMTPNISDSHWNLSNKTKAECWQTFSYCTSVIKLEQCGEMHQNWNDRGAAVNAMCHMYGLSLRFDCFFWVFTAHNTN